MFVCVVVAYTWFASWVDDPSVLFVAMMVSLYCLLFDAVVFVLCYAFGYINVSSILSKILHGIIALLFVGLLSQPEVGPENALLYLLLSVVVAAKYLALRRGCPGRSRE